MRDNARRLLTILTVILALWLVLGFWPLSIGNQVIFSLCILLAGGAALWRQRRRAVSRQRSEIVLPPEDFQGAVVLVCGDTDGLFPGRSAHGETRHGWYLRGDSAEQLPGLAQYLAAARPALVSQVSVLLAVVPEHHLRGASGAVAARLAAEYRPVPNLAKRSAAGVERVLGDAARRPGRGKPLVYHHAGEGWSPGAAEGTSAPGGCRVAAGGQPCLTPASDAVAGEHSDLGRKRSFRPFRARQAELPPLNLCAAGICLTPVAAVANNLWQQQIAAITTLSPGNDAAPGPHPLPDLLLSSLPHRHGVSRRMRDAGLSAGVGFLFLALAMLASFINNQRLVRSVGDHLAVYHRLSGTPPTPKLRRSSVCVPTAACWMTGCAGGAAALSAGAVSGGG